MKAKLEDLAFLAAVICLNAAGFRAHLVLGLFIASVTLFGLAAMRFLCAALDEDRKGGQ